jgi:hypothetical protein
MKTAIGLLVIALCGSGKAAAQIQIPSCGIRMSSSGAVMDCLWGGSAQETAGIENKQTVCDSRCEPVVYSITLSPGANLRNMVPGENELVIGMGGGELRNETKSGSLSFPMSKGVVLLMSKDELFALRNVGKQDIDLLVIRMHPISPASH